MHHGKVAMVGRQVQAIKHNNKKQQGEIIESNKAQK
jgi:hypothetical protein